MRKHLWWLIIFIKLSVSYIPFLQKFFKKMGFYSPGRMNNVDYAIKCFCEHVSKAKNQSVELKLSTVVELGPGGSNLSALIGSLWGVNETVLIDAQELSKNMVLKEKENYHLICKQLKVENPSGYENLNYKYFHEGLNSFKYLASGSVDFMWSHVVLQHVLLEEFPLLLLELNRVMKSGALMSHKVDFKDCISAGLNNLRFSDAVWNSKRFQASGFYTNRLRRDDMIKRFESAGFKIINVKDYYFEQLPIKFNQCSLDIRNKYTEKDLLYSGCHFICQKQ